MKKDHIFVSHSTKDDTFVNALRESLKLQGLDAWVDSCQLTGSDELEKEIKEAIRQARAFIPVLSVNAFNSPWMLKEIKHALEVQKERENDYPVIPLMLEGIEPAALNLYFEKEPVGITVKVGPGGISEAMPQILAALGEREPEDIQPMLTPPAEPLEELLLELEEPTMVKKKDGTRRARAKAKLTYVPGEKGKREVESKGAFLFTAPLGPIESEELTWYLERYYMWPTGVFKQRAEKVEQQLPEWGKALYDAVLNHPSARHVLAAWEGANTDAGRRFTVFVDSQLVVGAKEKRQAEANEAATLLLCLPWELMYEKGAYLFQGARPVQVRLLELPNLVRLLEHVRALDEPEAAVSLATRLEQLISYLGRKHLLAQVATIREEEAKKLPDWSHTRFESSRMQIERLLGSGNFHRALQEAQALLEKCLQTGEGAYTLAMLDISQAYLLLGRILISGGAAESAFQQVNKAYSRLKPLADKGNINAKRLTSVSLCEKGDCLVALGRLEEAAEAYKASIKISEDLRDSRGTAVCKGQLGMVRMDQKRYDEALKAYDEALKIFEDLGEPATVAVIWHQIGMVHEEANRFEAAEQAYRQSLAIKVQQNNPADEGSSLNQLGNLYKKMGRLEEAVIFYRQAADKSVEIGDKAKEGFRRNNLADTLIKLKRYDEARQEILRAVECKKPYGHAATPWTTWMILHNPEQAEGNREAAERAREQAIQLYLAYRRDGGENHEPGGRVCAWFGQALQEQPKEEIKKQFTALENDPDIPTPIRTLAAKLQTILAGSRDPGLAADPELLYPDAAEILFLLEKLEK